MASAGRCSGPESSESSIYSSSSAKRAEFSMIWSDKAQTDSSKVKRLASFLSHPRMTLAYRTKPLVTPYLQRWHRKRLARQVNLEFLSKRPVGSFSPNFSDLWFLYQTVRRKKPSMVIEFGSGCSSVVIAHALADNGREDPSQPGFLYSLDDQRRWADATSAMLPDAL